MEKTKFTKIEISQSIRIADNYYNVTMVSLSALGCV